MVIAVAALAAGAAAGWFGHQARAKAQLKAESSPAAAGSAGPCGAWQEKICGETGGERSAACQQAKAATELLTPGTCETALTTMPATHRENQSRTRDLRQPGHEAVQRSAEGLRCVRDGEGAHPELPIRSLQGHARSIRSGVGSAEDDRSNRAEERWAAVDRQAAPPGGMPHGGPPGAMPHGGPPGGATPHGGPPGTAPKAPAH